MATASTTASDSLVVESWQSPAENQTNSDRYLARRLEAAGADYKGVALTTFILGALVGTIAWAACGILVEHWLVSGGLPRVVRWGWLAAGLVALVAAAVRWLLPLVRYKVNLVYAAHAIERSNPDLHNDLVNTVLVKARPEGSAAVVVRSLEKRAAKRLADVPADAVIDRTQAVRLAYLLAVLVGAACLYELLAPKSLLVSAARLVAPWAGIAAPSRVWIESPRLHWRMPGGAPVDDGFNEAQRMEVDRGTATLVRGRQLVLSSGIRGLARGEKPVVHVVPLADGGSVDASAAPWTVEMTRGAAEADSGKAFTAMLPDASRGLENSVLISIAAGDSRSEPVRVVVIDSPSLLVREVRYDYPAYTARATETFEWQGDLRALEETQVTLIAECNQPLESAWIDFDCDGHRDLKLKVGTSDLARASVTFPLRLSADRSGPEHASYRLVFQPRDGLQGGREVVITEPLEHRIEVAADLAPEVSIESPTESPLTVPPAAPVTVRVRALDPDFALVKVAIETRVNGGRAAAPIVIFEGTKKGPFKGAGRLTPFSLGAGPGSVLEYRAVAFDNRGHEANQGSSPWQELRIDAAAPPRADEQPEEQPEEQRPGDNGRQGERRDQGAGDEPGDNGPAGDDPSDAAGNEEGGAGEQPPGNKSDPQQRDRQRKQQPNGEGDADAPQQQPGDEGAAGQGANPNGQQQGNGTKQQPGAGGEKQEGQEGSQPGNKQGAGRGTPGKQGPGEGNDSTAGKEPQEGSEEGEGAQSAGKEPGGKQGSGKQPAAGRSRAVGPDGRQPPNDSVAADGTNDGEAMDRILEHRRREDGELPQGTDGKKQGEGQKGEGQKGEGQKGEGQKGEGQKGEGQKGEGQKGEGQKGEGQKGEGQKGEGQKGEGQKGEGQKGEGQKGEGQKGEGQKGEGQKGEGQKGEGQKGEGQKGEGQKGEGQKGEGQKGEGQQGEGQQGEGQQGEGQQGEGQKGEGQKGEGQKGEGQQGEGQQGEGQQGEGQKGEGQKGEGQKGEGQQGEGQQGEGQQGEGQQGEGQKGEGQKGEGQQGEGQQGEGQQGEGQQGEGQKGEGQKGEGQKGEGQKGEGQKGEGQKGEGQKGEGQQGEGQQGEGDRDPGGKQAGGKRKGGQPPEQGPQPNAGGSETGGNQTGDKEGAGGQDPEKPATGQPGTSSSPTGSGGWSGGEGPPPEGGASEGENSPLKEAEWEEQDVDHARNAADLAIRTLKEDLDAGRSGILDELGWTRDQARAFLKRWEAMQAMARSDDPVKRGDVERAVRSLGLRPDGARGSRDVPSDVKGGQAEGRRTRPPSEYREQFKAYTQGTTGE